MIEITQGGARRRRDKRGLYVVLGVFVAVFLFSFLMQFRRVYDVAEAADLSVFDPGYIISDYQMSRYDAMSEAEIQAFLESKNACNNTSYSDYVWLSERYPNWKWNFKDGHFVCLAEELFGDGMETGSGETAAHIIWQAAQDYKINPQVLIVLLQKEQGLITDTYPNSLQYRSATGYGCPDTAPCSSQYYGFKNQVRKAAELFRVVLDGGWTNYPLGDNYVQYNPSRSCGGSVVNIRSLATSALYRYTPYQPNSAILAGWNDGCAAYGNLNFYKYFEDWFGGIKEEKTEVVEEIKRPMAEIESGTYTIVSAVNNANVIDISGGAESARDGTNIQTWKKNNTNAQKWMIAKNVDSTYTITNPFTSKVLDVAGGSTSTGANVQIWESNGSCAQKWKIEEDGEQYVFVSACSDLVLDVNGGSSASGTNIQLWSYNGSNAQKWTLNAIKEEKKEDSTKTENTKTVKEDEKKEQTKDEGLKDGVYSIHPLLDINKALDVEGGSFMDMANVQIFSYWTGNTAQEWEIKRNANEDYYTIKNAHSHKALDVAGGNLGNNTNIWMYSENGSCAQRWKLQQNDDGTYIIKNACKETLVLDVQDYGSNIQLYTKWGDNNSAQKWKLNKLR